VVQVPVAKFIGTNRMKGLIGWLVTLVVCGRSDENCVWPSLFWYLGTYRPVEGLRGWGSWMGG